LDGSGQEKHHQGRDPSPVILNTYLSEHAVNGSLWKKLE
jgi:hypothetical protein